MIYRADKVAQIEASSIRYQTANQISVKNTLGHIRKTVPPLKRTAYTFPVADSGLAIHDNAKKGIGFVFYFDIEEEDAATKPFAILVHRPNSALIPIAREAFGHGFQLSRKMK